MTDERWDVPSPRLARLTSAEPAPQFRECAVCEHRHPKGQSCGYQKSPAAKNVCRCSK